VSLGLAYQLKLVNTICQERSQSWFIVTVHSN